VTYNIVESIKTYLKSVSNLYAVVYSDSSKNITDPFVITPKVNVVAGSLTFIMVDNDDGADLTNPDTDKFLHWHLRYTGGSVDRYIAITAYNNLTGEVTIADAFDNDVPTTETLDLVVLDAIYINTGTNAQPYMKINATEETLPIYLKLQSRDDSTREKIRDNGYLIKADLIKIKKRLPIYDNVGDICGYMKIPLAINTDYLGNDENQIQLSMVSFTVSYTMNYK